MLRTSCSPCKSYCQHFGFTELRWISIYDVMSFWSAGEEKRKTAHISFPFTSVCLHVTNREPLRGFSYNFAPGNFTKIYRHVPVIEVSSF
jgi:hypothetical protein